MDRFRMVSGQQSPAFLSCICFTSSLPTLLKHLQKFPTARGAITNECHAVTFQVAVVKDDRASLSAMQVQAPRHPNTD